VRLIGVDSGKKGAISIISGHGLIETHKMPINGDGDVDAKALHKILFSNDYTTCYIEKVWGMSGQSSKSTFTQGKIYGEALIMCNHYCEDVVKVAAVTWKKALGVTADKQTSIKKAQELYPRVDLIPKPCRTPQDGIAEALLIMHYGINKEQELDQIMRGN